MTGRRDLSPNERQQLVGYLRALLNENDELPRESYVVAADEFGCDRGTARKVWLARNAESRPTRGGSKRKYDAVELQEAIKSIPPRVRTCVRSTAVALRMPPSTVQDYIGPGCPLRRATVCVKPTLSDEQKLERLRFVFSLVDRPIGKA
jgi:hypothetical protein